MLLIKTIVHETIWGGSRLTPFSGTNSLKIGHLYSLISNGEFESAVLNGKYKGRLFREYFDENKDKFGLTEYKEFPFLLAVLREKTAAGKYDDIIDYLSVEKGDYVYVEAGTMHAMAAGSLVFEIEENCNATYRVYDFDRTYKNGKKRPLQTEYALKSIDVSKKSTARKYNGAIKERLYSTQLFENCSEYKNESETIECLTVLNGKSQIDGFVVQCGSTIVLEPEEQVQLEKCDFIVSRPLTGGVK